MLKHSSAGNQRIWTTHQQDLQHTEAIGTSQQGTEEALGYKRQPCNKTSSPGASGNLLKGERIQSVTWLCGKFMAMTHEPDRNGRLP